MKKTESKTILLVGGGTGGHFYPIFRIYNKLKEIKDLRIFVVGSKSDLEMRLFSDNSDYIFLQTGKLHRLFTFKNIIEGFYLIYGLSKSLHLLLTLKPSLIFSKGGYVSLPIIFWARILKISYFIHESDIVIGSSNKFAGQGAKKVFTGFPCENYPKKFKKKVCFAGQIIKYTKDSKGEKILFDFGFENKKPIILITGGSQGAKSLNTRVLKSLNILLSKYNIIHQTGAYDYKRVIDFRAKLNNDLKNSYFVTDFLGDNNGIDMVSQALINSSLVVARAGATTISEIALFNKPMILIPFKYASLDHQRKNAEFLMKKKAAVMILEDNLSGKLLVSEIDKLINDKAEIKELTGNAQKVFPDDALDRTVSDIKKEIL